MYEDFVKFLKNHLNFTADKFHMIFAEELRTQLKWSRMFLMCELLQQMEFVVLLIFKKETFFS